MKSKVVTKIEKDSKCREDICLDNWWLFTFSLCNTQSYSTTVDQRFGCFSWPTRVDQLYLKLNKKLINFRNHDSGTKRNQKRNHSIFRWFRFVPDTKAEPCKFSLGSYQKQKRNHSIFSILEIAQKKSSTFLQTLKSYKTWILFANSKMLKRNKRTRILFLYHIWNCFQFEQNQTFLLFCWIPDISNFKSARFWIKFLDSLQKRFFHWKSFQTFFSSEWGCGPCRARASADALAPHSIEKNVWNDFQWKKTFL